jgi:hypothetical protein
LGVVALVTTLDLFSVPLVVFTSVIVRGRSDGMYVFVLLPAFVWFIVRVFEGVERGAGR